MAATAQEVIFTNQLTHQRSVNGRTGFQRRKWRKNYTWFPIKQNCVYSCGNKIYENMRERYGEQLYAELAQQRRLNPRLYTPEKSHNIDFSYIKKLQDIETTSAVYGLFPPYAYDTCFRLQGHRYYW